jgi:uncharacterized protein (TIGR03067 family)
MKRIGVLFLAFCGCGKAPPAPTDAQKIVGEWVVMDFHSPNATEDRGQRRKRAVVTPNTWSQQFQGDAFEDFEYALNPAATPKQIDLTFTAQNGKRLTVLGIYEMGSDEMGDYLRLCLGTPPVVDRDGKAEYVDSVRPTAFEPTGGPLIRFRRKTAE